MSTSGEGRGESPQSPIVNAAATTQKPLVGVIMGSQSDWPTMRCAAEALRAMGIPHECLVVSAHRTPDWLFEYASSAADRGLEVVIAGAGGAAHLPGMCAAKTMLPVIGVPVESSALGGLDALLSIAQMPAGVPVATVPIGKRGARAAGLLAGQIVAGIHTEYRAAVDTHRMRDGDGSGA